MTIKLINYFKTVNASYGLVFFSNNTAFAFLLICASFVNPCIGISGLVSVLFAIVLVDFFGLNKYYSQTGFYSFNSLLTGFALGAYFKLSLVFFVILLAASALTLLITSFFTIFSERNKLPFLSIPFVFTFWILLLNARGLESSFLIPKDSNACSVFFGESFYTLSSKFENNCPIALRVYFKSLAAIFFQSHILSGVLISIGLLVHSRIAFLLSFVGFFSGLYFQLYIQGHTSYEDYSFVAFNYILAALGIGGFFLIPSTASFLLTILSAPLLGLLNTAIYKIMLFYSLPLYSLPFSLELILLMALLNNRVLGKYLPVVQFQQYSPEKNLYAYHTHIERFSKTTEVPIFLPFYGEWTVSQGHNGELTHKEDWRHALDFVVSDEHKRTFKLPGKKVSDFYCYGLPVLAPASGQIVTVEDGVDDNEIGAVNLEQNWGNTVVIKHGQNLYSKLSHLKKGSFKVKQGEHIKKGDVLALCGNSGRSPEPHIHFQVQASEYIGAATIDYPICSYLVKTPNNYLFKFFESPSQGDVILRPVVSQLIKKAFYFIPGMKFDFEISRNGKLTKETWEVNADAFNNSYIQCNSTKTKAYFSYNDNLFHFTSFEGNTESLLYYFYLGAYKVLFSQSESIEIKDKISIEGSQKGFLKVVQDFLAPFYVFFKLDYLCEIKEHSLNGNSGIQIHSSISSKQQSHRNIKFEAFLTKDKIAEIRVIEKEICIVAKLTL